MNIKNCHRCGRIFNATFTEICIVCSKEVNQEYVKCANYLREHRSADIFEIHEKTGVSTQQIMKFVREGRLSATEMPNLTYPCDSCGSYIRRGRLCSNCIDHLGKSISGLRNEQSEKKTNTLSPGNIKFQINDRLMRDRN